MPHATNRYPFENKVWGALADLALQLTGSADQGNGFVAELSADGCLLSLFPERIFPDFRGRVQREFDESKLFYDPFEGPEYQYISWVNVKAETLERILKIQFTPEDLTGCDGSELDQIPLSHGVMF